METTNSKIFKSLCLWVESAHPDFAELDVFLGQHILLTLQQYFNPKM